MVGCQVKGCRNRSSRKLNKRLFAIPNPNKERSRCSKWLRFLGSDKFSIETYTCVVHDKSRLAICEDHFESECFEEDLRARLMGYPPKKKLKPDAIPTIPLIVRSKTGKRNSSKTSSSSERKKQKVAASKNANDEDCSEVIKEETSFEEFFIPPLFPSRLPLNEEDDDEPNPEFELKSDEDKPAHSSTDVDPSTESTSQLSTLQEKENEIGPYCEEAGISEADITSDFQNVSLLPAIKNGLVLEIYDHLHEMQIYNPDSLVATLKRLKDCPEASGCNIGAFIKRLVERRDRMQPETRKGAKDLGFLHEEEFLLIRQKHEAPRVKTLTKHLELAKTQRAETWKCLDRLEKDMQHSRKKNAALSKKVTELTTENKDLRTTVSSLEEQCRQLEQFKRKYRDIEEK